MVNPWLSQLDLPLKPPQRPRRLRSERNVSQLAVESFGDSLRRSSELRREEAQLGPPWSVMKVDEDGYL